MTSNPGDEKVIQDDIRFKGETSHNRFGIIGEQVSGRVGSDVYYDPANPGPYVDGADAIADVPTGGTILFAEGTYDVDTEGRVSTTRGINIVGSGHARDPDGTHGGTIIESSQTDGPPVEIRGPTDGNRIEAITVSDFAVHQNVSTTHPAVHISDVCESSISRLWISGNQNVDYGLHFEGQAFSNTVHGNRIIGWRQRGISYNGTGWGNGFTDNAVSSSGETGAVAFYHNGSRAFILGGTHTSQGTDGVGIHLDANDQGKHGSMVLYPGVEKTAYPLRVGGTYPQYTTIFTGFIGHMGSDVKTVLDLVNSNFGKFDVTYSGTANATGVNLVDYNSDSVGNNIYIPTHQLQDLSITGSPSSTDVISVRGAARETHMANYPTGVSINVPYMNEPPASSDRRGPALWDPYYSEWRKMGDPPVLNSGTATVAAGGSTTVSAGTGAGTPVGVDWWIANDPNGAPTIDYTITYDDTNEVQQVTFTETGGTTGADIGWETYRRDGVFVP